MWRHNIVGISILIRNVLTAFLAILFTKDLIREYLKSNDCRSKTMSVIGHKGRRDK